MGFRILVLFFFDSSFNVTFMTHVTEPPVDRGITGHDCEQCGLFHCAGRWTTGCVAQVGGRAGPAALACHPVEITFPLLGTDLSGLASKGSRPIVLTGNRISFVSLAALAKYET